MYTALVTSIAILSVYAVIQILAEGIKTESRKYILAVIAILAVSQIPMYLADKLPPSMGLMLERLPTRHWVFLIGPAVLLYARACIGNKSRPAVLFHLLPFFIWWILFLIFAENPPFLREITRLYGFSNILSLVSYGVWIQHTLAGYTRWLRNQYSYRDTFLEIKWLSHISMVLVFTAAAVSVAVTLYFHVAGQTGPSRTPPPFPGDPEAIDLIHATAVLSFLFVFSLLAQKQERYSQKGVSPIVEADLLEDKISGSDNSKEANALEQKPETSHEENAEFAEVIAYMESSKIYLDNTLSLQQLSDGTGIGRNELSRIINSGTGENFFHFINGYRAREFRSAVDEDRYPSYTLLGIAHECGFNSKSTFIAAVKREYDMTPSQILRETGSTL